MCAKKESESHEEFAKRAGYEVHHSRFGWFVIAPRETALIEQLKRRLDSRQTFTEPGAAWEVAAIRAERAGKKGGGR